MPLFLQEAPGAIPSTDEWMLWAILASPAVAWALIVLYLRKLPAIAGYATIAGVGVAMVLSFVALFQAYDADGGILIHTHEWFTAGPLEVNLGVRLDGLTAVMLVVVTVVSFLVQVYSQGYMAGDPGYGRYFAHMALFTTSMLGLVLADNLFMLFIFWELVGLSSYLLIGFWFHKPSAAAAAKKAFIVTRIGDLGLLAALILIWNEAGTFQVDLIQAMALQGELSDRVITLFGLGVFAGAAGKSAQFPLHVWLPDAMEGPTPVSALIHAATMVAAGVYLVGRFFPIFEVSADAAQTVAWIGAITALIAATIAVVQTDLKRVLAYSTISQLGYMMLGLGVLGYAGALFHLFTHAFFKALLFLGSGSVNHATNTFDMRKMGGLRKHMPITFWTFVIGTLSLAGIFPLAGFWSKDEILHNAWVDNRALWAIGFAVAGMTAFYMFRAIFLTFYGEYRGGEPVDHHDPDSHFHGDPAHPHESPWVMSIPLLILAVPAIGAGVFNMAGITDGFAHLIEGAVPDGDFHEAEFDWFIAISSTLIALAGIGFAWALYYRKLLDVRIVRDGFFPIRVIAEQKFFMDRIYEDLFAKTLFQRAWNRLVELVDTYIVDGIVNGSGWLTREASARVGIIQTGQLQLYGAGIAAGVVVIVAVIFAANPL
jgi:NADH-quinone oxidoreductase subunit L